MSNQTYEEYWKITNAFTNYDGEKFLSTLKICVDYIKEYKDEEYNRDKYDRLQQILIERNGLNDASVRKSINQLVKMGFIETFLSSCHKYTDDFLSAKTSRKRKSLLSKIVYSNSKLGSSVTKKSELHQINFLINTLVETGSLSREDITALMLVDIKKVNKGYLNREELDNYVEKVKRIDFVKRKYNQVSHLTNLLGKLDDIVFVGDELYFTEDAKQLFGEDLEIKKRQRNPYLHLIYKNELKEESRYVFNQEKCMVEKLAFPTLIASHIKPYIQSEEEGEAYNPNNGILISQNLDGLFDKGRISFNDDGSIIISSELDEELKKHLQQYSLDSRFLVSERLVFLAFHREHFREKLK